MFSYKVLTSWRVLQHSTVVVFTWSDRQLTPGHGLTNRAASDDLDLARIVLPSLRNIEVVHTVVRELIALTLQKTTIRLHQFIIQVQLCTYIDNSVSIDEPHNSRLRMTGNTAAEPSPFTFLDLDGFGLADKRRFLLGLLALVDNLWNTVHQTMSQP